MNILARTLKIFISGPLLFVVLLLVGLGAWTAWQSRNDTFRYRLTVEVASGAEVYAGSGVIQVTVRPTASWSLSSSAAVAKVTGDAVVVEVPDRPPVFVLLAAKNNADWDAGIAFKVFRDRMPDQTGISTRQAFRQDTATLAHLREKAEIPSDLYPLMVAFRDINRPASVYQVYPDDLSPPLDPGARVVGMTIEMTDAPATEGTVARLLPWVVDMPGFLNGQRFSTSGALAGRLNATDFMKRGI